MKKRLNVDLIQSELRGGSAFFPGYKGNGSPTLPSETLDSETASQSSTESSSQPVVQKVASTIDDPTNQQTETIPVKQGGTPSRTPYGTPYRAPHK